MNKKPLIGVLPQYQVAEHKIRIFPEYMDAIMDAGGIPFLLPFARRKKDLKKIVQKLDGFLFTGGQDVSPELYHQDMCHCSNEILPIRDELETQLFKEILKVNKPVLGICRGLQLINVVLGGTLFQDVNIQNKRKMPLQHEQKAAVNVPVHSITIKAASLLYAITKEEHIDVNSFHHQGIKKLGNYLEVVDRSNDGLIEAVQIKTLDFGLAVQWHPELLYSDNVHAQKLFKAFIKASKKISKNR